MGGCEADIEGRVPAAWRKWREVAGVVCDKKMPIKLKVKIHSTVIRPVLFMNRKHGLLEEAQLERAEMIMLRCIYGNIAD